MRVQLAVYSQNEKWLYRVLQDLEPPNASRNPRAEVARSRVAHALKYT